MQVSGLEALAVLRNKFFGKGGDHLLAISGTLALQHLVIDALAHVPEVIVSALFTAATACDLPLRMISRKSAKSSGLGVDGSAEGSRSLFMGGCFRFELSRIP